MSCARRGSSSRTPAKAFSLPENAGTGKTTFLKTVVERSKKRPIVVAPTGVAAINAGGMTIHSFFQLPLSPYVPGAKVESRFDFGREKRKIIASIDLLIIDEISMVRADLLDAVDAVLRRFRQSNLPFGGVQLLMIGDLAQLTPVVTPEDETMLKPYYDTPYFFGSKALARTDYVTIQLEHVYRQQDESFIDILNQVRVGKPTAEALGRLNSRALPLAELNGLTAADSKNRAAPGTEGGAYIRLTTHNNLANFYNNSELQKLGGKSFMFRAEIKGTFPEYAYPTAETLVLKLGAQVMFIKNDPSANRQFYNGRIGRVVYVDERKVLVHCEGDDEAIEVEPMEWENTRFTLNAKTREIERDVQGVFCQFPLRLAWAITIHKSQGLTFDRVIIDANQSFAPGQVYVALSRCRTLEGLVLAAPLHPGAIINDKSVDDYIARQEQQARQSIEELPALKKEYQRYLLLQLFDFNAIVQLQETMVRLFAEFFYHSHASLKQLNDQTLADLQLRVAAIADKWRARIRTLDIDSLHADDFLERVKRSADYFADNLDDILAKPLMLDAKVETNNKQAKKRLATALPELRQAWLARRYLLTRIAEQGFSVETYLREKQLSALDALEEGDVRRTRASKPKPKKEEKPKTWEVSFQLYKQGKNPDLIARERGLTIATVMSHLTRYVLAGDVKLDDLVPTESQQAILRVVRKIGTEQGTTAIKNLCPPEVSYEDIRLVLTVMEKAAK